MSKEYIDKMLKAIVGFTIEVTTVENVFKLSQNKTTDEQLNIIDQLTRRGDENSKLIAGEMKKLISTNQA
jgi:transcriptional regulator